MSDRLVIQTIAGRVRGRSLGSVTAHLGIPYAAAPVGELRWAPPQPRAPWPAVRDATALGPAAPQPERPIGQWSHGDTPLTDEDCLSVNVWAPAGAQSRPHPVLVWLHGGGWALGFSGSPAFDGAHLAAAAGVVVVTLNYRLGSIGWLNHPDLGANWGLRDQAMALAWVHDNIDQFGGDPTAVTISGQSAGAGSALHLLASPCGEGLFSRLIAQSPPMGELTIPAERGRAWALALSSRFGGVDRLDMTALRTIGAVEIVRAHEDLLAADAFRGTRGGAMPVCDDATLPVDPRAVPSARPDVPVLIGTTVDEATFLFRAAGRILDPDDRQLAAMIAHLPDVDGEARAVELIADERATGSELANIDVLCRLATRQLFRGPVQEWARRRAAAGAEVLTYSVEHRSPDAALGATHTIDVPLLFGTYGGEVGRRVAGDGEPSRSVSQAMMAAWREFLHGRTPWDPDQVYVFG
jgi:para-nitrobenzyl esterase